MKGMSAHQANRSSVRKPAAKPRAETLYTIDGNSYTFVQVLAAVHKINSSISDTKLKSRLENGHRDMAILTKDKLPHFRPKGLRGRYA